MSSERGRVQMKVLDLYSREPASVSKVGHVDRGIRTWGSYDRDMTRL